MAARMTPETPMHRRAFTAVLAVSLAVFSAGCVERRFVVESNPPGAVVFVNNERYGATPVDIPFLYYGNYDIQLVKDGYQTKTIKQKVETPWYEYPGIDFFSEILNPLLITDMRPLYYELDPVAPPNLDQLKIDADDLRRQAKGLPAPRYPELDKKDPPKRKPAPPPPPAFRPPGDNTFPSLPRELPDPPPVAVPPLVVPPE